MILAISIVAALLSMLPAAMFLANLSQFCVLGSETSSSLEDAGESVGAGERPAVSVLVPARDEEDGIGECIESSLHSTGVNVEVIVLDDDSTDGTAGIVESAAKEDERVRLIRGAALPAGWNGKQHACKQLADAATNELLVFIDADVRLKPDALSRLVAYKDENGVSLLSAFPHQITGTWLERWLIPMMHFILLGYLPFSRMRQQVDPSLSAGCGQLFLTSATEYRKAGTHEAIKSSRHDGVKLPRAYRNEGLMTDVVDGTELAQCRMYRGAREVIRGVLKNATEGIANPRVIGVFTGLLLGCSVLPVFALMIAIWQHGTWSITIASIALVIAHVPRLVAAGKLNQSWFGAVCHVPATLLFLVLQWIALANQISGRKVAWRGRTES